jgi:hypothetical protein
MRRFDQPQECAETGRLQFARPEEYNKLRKRIVGLYKQRSKATHRAAFNHVTERDAADLSQWVSWLILNSLIFVENGISSTNQMKAWTQAVHRRNRPEWSWLRALPERARRCQSALKNYFHRLRAKGQL